MGGGGSKGGKMYPNCVHLDHFDMERMVGRGGFGKVNAAQRVADTPAGKKGEWVAIKTLSKEITLRTKGGLDMIFNERDCLAALSSPYVANMIHAFQDDANCYLVLDLCLAGDLGFRMKTFKDGVFDEAAMKFFSASIAMALQACHDKKILHRDVKPENIIMDTAGHCRITDFGISIVTTDLTCTEASGTKGYMSPESYSSGRLHGAQHDYFGLGCCAYKFGAAECPFMPKGASQFTSFVKSKKGKDLKKKLDKKMLPDWDKLKSTYSDDAKDFIRLCLEPRVELRPKCLDDVKAHKFFEGFDWDGLFAKTSTPPCVPDLSQANCDASSGEEALDMFSDEDEKVALSAEVLERFRTYDFRTEWGGTGGGPSN
jgi:serine/threonine kinase 32